MRTLVTALAVSAGLMLPALATDIDSAYTDVDLADCTILQADDFGASWACPGYRGMPVYVAEGDLRFFVSYGFYAPDKKAARQTLPPFNRMGQKIEWRVTNASGDWLPFATILRFITEKTDGEGNYTEGEILVVTKLGEEEVCHTAYIDALANVDANQMARDAADRAPDFDCEDGPETLGEWSGY